MKRTILMIVIALCVFSTLVNGQYDYPKTRTVNASDTFWGVTVADPYRWLEDLKDPEVVDWFKAQADYTNAQMAKIPGRDALIKELKELDAMEPAKYSPVGKFGGKDFYFKQMVGEQPKLYCRQGETGSEVLLFDPLTSIPGKLMIPQPVISSDGSRVLLNLTEGGSEVGEVRILEVATAKLLPDTITHSTSARFVGGGSSEIIYHQMKNSDVHDSDALLDVPVKLHVIGSPIDSDIVVVSREKYPKLELQASDWPRVSTPKNSPYIFISWHSDENEKKYIYYAAKTELKAEKINWKKIVGKEEAVREFWVSGNDIYLLTPKNNPLFQIIKTDIRRPDLKKAKVIADGGGDWKLSPQAIAASKDLLYITKSKNELVTKVFIYEFKTGKLRAAELPTRGNFMPLSPEDGAVESEVDNGVILFNSGWNVPYSFSNYNGETGKLVSLNKPVSYPGLDNIVYEEVEVPSHDGAMVPLSIVYDKTKLKKDGSNICLMMGYGSYGITGTPVFGSSFLTLYRRGVVLAFSAVLGGGEKGNEWHLAGQKTNKPNTWKDFNASAEYLIKNKYTSPDKLGISGTSAGGILVGRAVTSRPDLYKVAMPNVGIMNALRFEFTPNGPDNIREFGTVKNESEFKALMEMDAYLHIQKGVKYPAHLITTGFNDPRVASHQPGKYAARIQVDNGSDNPIFLAVDFGAGHFGATTQDERFARNATGYAFLLWQTGHPEFQP